MKILIIGGAGYIGSHVALEFLNKNYEVKIFDNLSTGELENVPPQAEFVKGDILDAAALAQAVKNVSAIVHLAAKKAVGESMLKPEIYSINNITGTLNILNAATAANIKNFIFSSSASVYGIPEKMPITEETPLGPINYYGFTKLEIERFLAWYDKLKGIKFAALRYFNAVGYDAQGRIRGKEKNPQNLLPLVMEAANGTRAEIQIFGNDYPTPDGTCLRDYIHVSDLAEAHVQALDFLQNGGQSGPVNLGTGKGYSVLEVVNRAIEITGKKINYKFAPRRPGDPAVLLADASRAGDKLSWQAKHSSLDNIIKTTWAIYK
jgi:UDP-glucose 4-epimerase